MVWAFPRTAGVVTETIVCCIKHNPEPLLLRVQCEGVTPELHLPKAFEFGKVLLHRCIFSATVEKERCKKLLKFLNSILLLTNFINFIFYAPARTHHHSSIPPEWKQGWYN